MLMITGKTPAEVRDEIVKYLEWKKSGALTDYARTKLQECILDIKACVIVADIDKETADDPAEPVTKSSR